MALGPETADGVERGAAGVGVVMEEVVGEPLVEVREVVGVRMSLGC